MSGGQGSSKDQRFAVISRRVVFVVGSVFFVGGVLAILNGRRGLGIALIVAPSLGVVWRGLWTVTARPARARRAGPRAGARRPGPGPGAPAPVEDVVAALVGMNSDGLPYQIDATRSADGVRVDVKWKNEEMRWQTLFVRGSQAYAWRMEVDLDPAKAQYKFVEHSGKASVRAAAGPLGRNGLRQVDVAEGQDGGRHVGNLRRGRRRPGQSDRTGRNPHLVGGRRQIKPADAKVPVFTVLRNNGWRPRFDWFGARLFEK